MLRKLTILSIFLIQSVFAISQSNAADTTTVPSIDHTFIVDTTLDYERVFRDFESFIDSLLSPNSYTLVSFSIGKGYYNFENKNNLQVNTIKQFTYSPVIGYFHKSGIGISANGYMTDDGKKLNFFQAAISSSFDYLKNKRIATGISYTRFFTKNSLSFYTTPIQNEIYAYFTYRKWWIRPMLALSYGWGSRTEYQERELLIQDLRLRRRGFTYINTKETVSDFSIMASLRHDFYRLDIFSNRDHIRFTPQLMLTCGTQKFGFNQSSSTYAINIRNTSNSLYITDNIYLNDELNFQPLSVTLFLRGEYATRKFFAQPQLIFDYFFPAAKRKFNSIFVFNTGFMF